MASKSLPVIDSIDFHVNKLALLTAQIVTAANNRTNNSNRNNNTVNDSNTPLTPTSTATTTANKNTNSGSTIATAS